LLTGKAGAVKILGVVLVVALISTSFIGCLGAEKSAIDKIKDRKKLIIGTSSGFPPFEMINGTTNKMEGFDIDIAQAVADSLGVSLEVRDLDFSFLIGSVKIGLIDIAVAGMTITSDRNKSVSFSNPYYKADQAIIVLNGSTIQTSADLQGKKIAVNLGTTGDIWVTSNLVDTGLVAAADVHRFGFASAAFLELTTHHVDAVVIDKPVADAYVASAGGVAKVVYTIVTNEYYGIAMRQSAKDLVSYVNVVLQDLKDSGEYDRIVQKWFP